MSDMSGRSWLTELLDELKRRRVIRVATLYVVIFWPIIQVVDILSPALGLPDTAMRYLVTAFVGGLPIVLILAWIFDLNQNGLVRDTGDGTSSETGRALIGSRTELGIIAVMLLVAAALFYVQVNVDDVDEGTRTVQRAGQPTTATPVVGINSIAVLPFDSFSGDERDRFFADGLTEELLNVLARVNGLRVAARTSSFAYRGVRKTVPEIGRELGVGTILEGSVRRNDIDDTIRVTAQLVETGEGKHLWSATFDRQYSDVFRIQDEIARAVVSQLSVTLLGDEERDIVSHASANPEAMITYSMGQTELARRSPTATRDAIRFFERALDLDPNYAEAWVGLADAHTLTVSYDWGEKTENLEAAQAAVDKALALDDRLGIAWASQGLLYSVQDKVGEAKAALEKALALNPNYAMAHMWYAGLLDDMDKKFEHNRRAYELDPRSPVAGYNLAQLYINRGQDSEAMQLFSQIIDADPYYAKAYELVARISAERGRYADAIGQLEKAWELQQEPGTAFGLAQLQTNLGNFAAAKEWIDIAKPGEPPERYVAYDWLEVQRLQMQGETDKARELIASFTEPRVEQKDAELIAAYASHLLGDRRNTITMWEAAEERLQGKNLSIQYSIYDLARIGAAEAYREAGQDDKANALLADVKRVLDDAVAGGIRVHPEIWFKYALLSAASDQPQMALIHLQRAVDEGWRDYWHAELEPLLADISQQTEFETMMAAVKTRLDLMREQYAFDKSFAATSGRALSGS